MQRLERSPSTSSLRRAVTTTLAALCLFSVAIHPSYADEDQTTEVPSLIGKMEADALTLLSDRGLKVEIVHVNDGVADPGTVIGQDPKSGSEILRGSKVVLRVTEHTDSPGTETPGTDDGAPFPEPEAPESGDGVAMAVMPDLLGRSMGDAELALVDLGLTPRFTLVTAADRAPHTVIAQDQAPNTELALGTEIHLEIAKPVEAPTQARVPYLRGLSEAAAAAQLEALGFGASIVRKISTWPQGRVFSQSPSSGAFVPYGSNVTLVVAVKPPTPVKVKVPNVSGMKPNEARLALLARGLLYKKSKALGPNRDIKRIFKQSRTPGARVLPGTRVTFYLPLVAKMPNVMGLTKIKAKQKVQAAGLNPVLSGPAPAPMFTTKVIAQLPAANTYLAKGSNVKVVYKNKAWIVLLKKPVPNMIGMNITKAKNQMLAAGFKTKFFGPANGLGIKVVKTQNPAPGTMFAVGKTVNMTYKFKFILIPGQLKVKVPNVKGMPIAAAKAALQAKGLKWQILGFGGFKVKKQFTAAGTKVLKGTKIKLLRGV